MATLLGALCLLTISGLFSAAQAACITCSVSVPAAVAAGATAGLLPPSIEPGVSYYYDEFDPDLRPWRPAEERNYEEVFKNYQFFEVKYAAGLDRLSVTRHVRNEPVSTREFTIDGDGALREVKVLSAAELYTEACAACHGRDRLGISGPALLPENLGRLKKRRALEVIRDGRPATQMPGFGHQLDEGQLAALVEYLYTPPERPPVWTAREIRASHQSLEGADRLPDRPVFSADPLNVFLVVETGDHHITVLDGDTFEPIHRFRTRFALHGGPKFSPDGRFVYLASRDGWISKFDLYNLKVVAEIRAGINTRNLAVSGDGRWVLVGNYFPRTLVLLDAHDLSLLRVIDVEGADGAGSRVSAVYQAAPRDSFVVALKDIPEVWEIGYGKGDFPVRRIAVDAVLDDFFFDQDYRLLIGANRATETGQVVDLDSGKVVAAVELGGMPHLGSGIIWEYQGRPVMATPHLKDGAVSIIDMRDWKVIKRIETLGPGFFMRSHENTPYAWVDVFFGPNRDAMHVIDKRTLEIVTTLIPEKGKTSAHVEFTRDGSHALVSIWDMDGALVIYDAATLKEVRRLPMKKPSGKYNVYNKITRSAGTSH